MPAQQSDMSELDMVVYDEAVGRRNHLYFDDIAEFGEGLPQAVLFGVAGIAANVDLAVLDHPPNKYLNNNSLRGNAINRPGCIWL